jgi:hypothetical protein
MKHKKQFVIPKSMQSWDKRTSYWETIFCKLAPFLVPNHVTENFAVLKEPHFHYSEMPNVTQNICLDGYFQSWKYFQNSYDEICDQLGLYELRKSIRDKYVDRVDWSSTISLHFRMGDYKNMPNHHPLVSDDYYINSLHHIIKNKRDKWTVLYCCEESDNEIVLLRIRSIKNKLNDDDLIFVKIDASLNDYEQMLLMSCCEHNIIANSSFSWWSAYINDNLNKVVCYPSVWFGVAYTSFNTVDLHPPSWNKISV